MTLRVSYQTMHIDFFKGNLSGKFQPHHNHAGDPEENNIKTGH